MSELKNQTLSVPPPDLALLSPSGHPLPRRAQPENSITLRHHRQAREREASLRPNPSQSSPDSTEILASKRNKANNDSTDSEEHNINQWFDESNLHPKESFGNNAMDVDPPFYQKPYGPFDDGATSTTATQALRRPQLGGETVASSSADDYRSVIDDLTVEIQRLKEELKQYKQTGPEALKNDKLFEIKMHRLSKKKRRELEATLRDFASSLDGTDSLDVSTTSRKKSSSRNADRKNMGRSGTTSKHASSSAGSNSRPVDSAYASMSTDATSSGTSLARPAISSNRTRSSQQKVQNYLRDIPEGLYPRYMLMTENEKKKLVVRRLEQIFTGRIKGHNLSAQSNQPQADANTTTQPYMPTILPMNGGEERDGARSAPVGHSNHETTREAKFLPQDVPSTTKPRSRDNVSMSCSHNDPAESSSNNLPAMHSATSLTLNDNDPDQHATRVRDLDPYREQFPLENMEYLRHLGLLNRDSKPMAPSSMADVSPDADGWVYLNLIGNMAQLHILNVTPDFIKKAVSEKSKKFQLSSDGTKIRWRGGAEGTKFSSDSSVDASQKSSSVDEFEDRLQQQEPHRKRQKTVKNGDVSAYARTAAAPTSGLSNFHYKPMFLHKSSSLESSLQDSSSSNGNVDDFLGPAESQWDQSRSGPAQQRKKRRNGGAIIYYSGAPFCTDLSGDPGETSPTTNMEFSEQGTGEGLDSTNFGESNSSLGPTSSDGTCSSSSHRPLIFKSEDAVDDQEVIDMSSPKLIDDNMSDTDTLEFTWSDSEQISSTPSLEPCGLGGVLPEDHFKVIVKTLRPREDIYFFQGNDNGYGSSYESSHNYLVNRMSTMTTSSPRSHWDLAQRRSSFNNVVPVHYVSQSLQLLDPVPLPPPTIFYSFLGWSSTSSSSSPSSMSSSSSSSPIPAPLSKPQIPESGGASSLEGISPYKGLQFNPHLSERLGLRQPTISTLADNKMRNGTSQPSSVRANRTPSAKASTLPHLLRHVTVMEEEDQPDTHPSSGVESSMATAGGAESGYSTDAEDS